MLQQPFLYPYDLGFGISTCIILSYLTLNIFVTRYGGWSFGQEGEKVNATVWFNNRAFHSPVSYLNALSNMILRAAVGEGAEYGITTYNHPLSISSGQLSIRNILERTADLGVSLVILAALSFIPAGKISRNPAGKISHHPAGKISVTPQIKSPFIPSGEKLVLY